MSMRRLIDPCLSLPAGVRGLLCLALLASLGVSGWACYALSVRDGYFVESMLLLAVGILGQHITEKYPVKLQRPHFETLLLLCFAVVWGLILWGILQMKMDPDHITGWQIHVVFIVFPVPLTLAFARSISRESGHVVR